MDVLQLQRYMSVGRPRDARTSSAGRLGEERLECCRKLSGDLDRYLDVGLAAAPPERPLVPRVARPKVQDVRRRREDTQRERHGEAHGCAARVGHPKIRVEAERAAPFRPHQRRGRYRDLTKITM